MEQSSRAVEGPLDAIVVPLPAGCSPGPWTVEVLGSTVRVVSAAGVDFGDDVAVVGDCHSERCRADAMLIAAAPLLYAQGGARWTDLETASRLASAERLLRLFLLIHDPGDERLRGYGWGEVDLVLGARRWLGHNVGAERPQTAAPQPE